MIRRILAFALLALPAIGLRADAPVEAGAESDQKSLDAAPGLAVELFAADPSIAKPIQMNFDAAGRLWLVCSESYPQLKPDAEPSDKIYVLEDTNGDGKADKSTLFAEGLLIPTGIEIGDGGVYVGQSTEVIHLSDTDGDGKADKRRVVLSGFGTEDTHHLVHSFRYGPEGLLYFAQSIYIHSHVETPWGVRRLGGGGYWRYRPAGGKLDVFVRGMVNSWGIAFDDFGQAFGVDNDNTSIKYFVPGARYHHTPGESHILGGLVEGKPKYCGIEFLSGRHLPEAYRGDLVVCDFRAHRVCRYRLVDEGSGYRATELEPLVTSGNVAFRPIDVKMGPDGALYVCDWTNPIINHGEVDFRDPRRDRTRGRIWRVVAKGRDRLAPPRLIDASIESLLEAQNAPEGWTRHFASRALAERPKAEVLPPLLAWTDRQTSEKVLLRALWLFQGQDVANEELLDRLLNAKEGRVRAAAVRAVSLQRNQIVDPVGRLAKAINDSHPRVRLEAVRALSLFPERRATELALSALDHPMDPYLDYGLKLAARETASTWLPAVADEASQISDQKQISKWIYSLLAVDTEAAAAPLATFAARRLVEAKDVEAVLRAVARLGAPEQLRVALGEAIADPPRWSIEQRKRLLDSLLDAARVRKQKPSGSLADAVDRVLADPDLDLRMRGVDAIAAWKVEERREFLESLADDEKSPDPLRSRAIDALASLGGAESRDALSRLGEGLTSPQRRGQAVAALVSLDPDRAMELTRSFFEKAKNANETKDLVAGLLRQKAGPAALAKALTGVAIAKAIAEEGVRQVNGAGADPALLASFIKAGNLPDTAREPSPDQIARIAKEASGQGDAARGEAIFAREKLRCFICHQVGGKGGKVGPDLTAIGASAPVDYLVESLLAPNRKVKENYHAATVVTTDGRVLTGIPERKSEKEWVLRDAEDKTIVIPAADIESSKLGASLMPAGLVDELTAQDLRDLTKYLSELGKPGRYGPAKELLARKWRILGPLEAASVESLTRELLEGGPRVIGRSDWQMSLVTNAGWIYLREFTLKPTAAAVFALAPLQVDKAGPARLILEPGAAAEVWLDGRPIKPVSVVGHEASYDVSLEPGTRHLLARIDLKKTSSFLKLRAFPIGPKASFRFVE